MATYGCRDDDDDDDNNNAECLTNWPLEYVKETEEYICGRCGQVLLTNHTTENVTLHFQSCKNSAGNGLVMAFKELRKMNKKCKMLNAVVSEMQKKEDEKNLDSMEKTETEKLNLKTEFQEEISNLKADIKKDLQTEIDLVKRSGEKSDAALSTLLNRVNILEERMKEKIAVESGEPSAVSEPVSTNNSFSNELDKLKKETEAIWVQLRKNEEDILTLKTRSEGEPAQLKTGVETPSELLKTNDRELQVQKRQLESENKEMEGAQQLVKKKKIVQQEPSMLHQFTFRHELKMNCFNLVTQSHRFSSSCVWDINGFAVIFAQKTCKMTSEVFIWGGYPVEARAKLQLKEDDCVYLSLSLEDVLKNGGKLKDLSPIPQVFYLLKDQSFTPRIHKCYTMGYLFDTAFNYSLGFETCLGHKSWLHGAEGNVWNFWNSSVKLEIFVEPSHMTQHVHSYDGTLEWKVENYERRLELGKSYFAFYQRNPYFYTSPRGYRVQVEIFLKDEEGKGGLTAIISFMTGKFDAELSKSFLHSTTVTLMNRKDPQRSITKTMVEDIKNKKEYTFEICKVEEAANLIENDTLLCKVVIKAQ